MAGSVGGVSCDFVRGMIPTLKERVIVYTQPGQDGYGRHNVGKSVGEFTLRIVKHGSVAGVETWEQSICALVGNSSRITIANDIGQSNTNCSVIEAGQAVIEPAVNTALGYVVRGTMVLSCIVEA